MMLGRGTQIGKLKIWIEYIKSSPFPRNIGLCDRATLPAKRYETSVCSNPLNLELGLKKNIFFNQLRNYNFHITWTSTFVGELITRNHVCF